MSDSSAACEPLTPRSPHSQRNRFIATLRRLQPYALGIKPYIILVIVSVIVTAITEPLVPALLKALLEHGFGGQHLALWIAPTALIGLFTVRGLSTFLAK